MSDTIGKLWWFWACELKQTVIMWGSDLPLVISSTLIWSRFNVDDLTQVYRNPSTRSGATPDISWIHYVNTMADFWCPGSLRHKFIGNHGTTNSRCIAVQRIRCRIQRENMETVHCRIPNSQRHPISRPGVFGEYFGQWWPHDTQSALYWLCMLKKLLSYKKNDFNPLWHASVLKW